jgi:hypothetical protein
LLSVRDGTATTVSGRAGSWRAPTGAELIFDDALAERGTSALRAYGVDGRERFRAAYAIQGPLELAGLRSGSNAPVLMVSHRGETRALAVEPQRGTIEAVHVMPRRWVHGSVFSTTIDGRPLAGVVLQKPLAVHIF